MLAMKSYSYLPIATLVSFFWNVKEVFDSIIHNFVAFTFLSIIVIDVGYAPVDDAIFGCKTDVQDPENSWMDLPLKSL